MLKKFVLAFAILAVALATAGTVPGSRTYTITIIQPAVLNGTHLKPGDYRLVVEPAKVTLLVGKDKLDLPTAKVESVEQKYDATAIRYTGDKIEEIRLGGTKTHILMN